MNPTKTRHPVTPGGTQCAIFTEECILADCVVGVHTITLRGPMVVGIVITDFVIRIDGLEAEAKVLLQIIVEPEEDAADHPEVVGLDGEDQALANDSVLILSAVGMVLTFTSTIHDYLDVAFNSFCIHA